MKTILFARKFLLELWRSPQLFWLYLLFPTMMVLIYYSAFGQNSGMANYLTILIHNDDAGDLGEKLVKSIQAAEFDGQPAFSILKGYSLEASQIILNEGKATLLLRIPAQFSETFQQANPVPARIELVGDPSSDTFAFSYSFLGDVFRQFSDEHSGWSKKLPVRLEFLPNTGTLNDFQVGLPGLIIFGIMFGVISTALLLTRERSDGTLQRIQLSKTHAVDLLGGLTLGSLILSLLQMAITFSVAAAVGFIPVGSPLLVIGIGVLSALFATGAGLFVACFAKNEGEATALSTAVMVPLVFLSGSIFPLPNMVWFKVFEQPVQAYDLLPSTHAANAMSKVILYGATIPNLTYELMSLLTFSILTFIVGIFLYQKRVLTRFNRS